MALYEAVYVALYEAVYVALYMGVYMGSVLYRAIAAVYKMMLIAKQYQIKIISHYIKLSQ